MRLTCEARGSGVTQPSAADCNASSTRLAGLFTFHNGANSTPPPDVRNLAHLKAPGYSTLAGGDQSSYSGGSGKVVTFTRGAGNTMTLGYDVVGRRSFEYDSIDPVRSRRDYTYLPNGQLGTITGKTPTSVGYTTSVNYDHEGRHRPGRELRVLLGRSEPPHLRPHRRQQPGRQRPPGVDLALPLPRRPGRRRHSREEDRHRHA